MSSFSFASVAFPRFYRAIKAMVAEAIVSTPVARDIVRKSGFMQGSAAAQEPNVFGIPRGGKKGYALVKRSDEDFDCEWQPHGPYVYDWNEYLAQAPPQWRSYEPIVHEWDNPASPTNFQIEKRYKDRTAAYSIEPVPQVIESWVHINEDLRTGVENAGALGFVFERWRSNTASVDRASPLIGSATWTWHEPETEPVTDEAFVMDVTGGDPYDRNAAYWQHEATQNIMIGPLGYGLRSIGTNDALMRVRVQAYVSACSESAYFSLGLGSDGVHSFISRFWEDDEDAAPAYYMQLEGPGYYDSGWIAVRGAFSESGGVGHLNGRLELRFYDFDTSTPAIPFTEVQLVGYEFTGTFDFLYERGDEPSR